MSDKNSLVISPLLPLRNLSLSMTREDAAREESCVEETEEATQCRKGEFLLTLLRSLGAVSF